MAVATVSEVSKALRTALAEIDGLRVIEFIPDSLNPPMATVGIDNVVYHGAFGAGNPLYLFTVSVVVARASDRIAQPSRSRKTTPRKGLELAFVSKGFAIRHQPRSRSLNLHQLRT
jgi:hypothetical protein